VPRAFVAAGQFHDRVPAVYPDSALLLFLVDLQQRGMSNLREIRPGGPSPVVSAIFFISSQALRLWSCAEWVDQLHGEQGEIVFISCGDGQSVHASNCSNHCIFQEVV
jgi:hypothetical protein